MKENDRRYRQQQHGGHVQQRAAPTPYFEEVVTNRVDSAEVQEEWRKHDHAGAAQKSDHQIQISIGANRRVKVKDERGQAKGCELQNERRSPALLKNYKQAHEQIDYAD